MAPSNDALRVGSLPTPLGCDDIGCYMISSDDELRRGTNVSSPTPYHVTANASCPTASVHSDYTSANPAIMIILRDEAKAEKV
ncbi:hypothetical protein NPX13_g8707 [Xylaria arbuscula]|uniref:Uncharacterized protein n=1 Tax=Xylaria arbuscula TaxID=114810 RepID=A0A9W8N869_9PEZI|nr:hypothetical protein NPX13_g8707 [Xylaria arbuscula]